MEKLLAYERTPAPLAQRARMIFIADNYRDANGTVDGAGDFAIFADAAVALQPANAKIERVCYDPSPSHSQDPWREPAAVAASRKTREALARQESLRTFLLLGDPLTGPQAAVEWNYWLPRVGHE